MQLDYFSLRKMKVACLQIEPELKDWHTSVQRAESLIEGLTNESLDLILLPEMALIGYRFESREEIAPFTEVVPQDVNSLIDALENASNEEVKTDTCTFRWAFSVSKRFAPAWVVVGFAERDNDDRYFNSVLVVNYELRTCHVIRKVLHWTDDKLWATLESSVSGVEYNYQYQDLFFPRLQR